MYNFADRTDPGPGCPPGPSPHAGPGRPGLVRMVVAALLIGAVASLLFGSTLWAVGLVFHLVGLIVKLFILIAVGGFIWRRVVHRHAGSGRI